MRQSKGAFRVAPLDLASAGRAGPSQMWHFGSGADRQMRCCQGPTYRRPLNVFVGGATVSSGRRHGGLSVRDLRTVGKATCAVRRSRACVSRVLLILLRWVTTQHATECLAVQQVMSKSTGWLVCSRNRWGPRGWSRRDTEIQASLRRASNACRIQPCAVVLNAVTLSGYDCSGAPEVTGKRGGKVLLVDD